MISYILWAALSVSLIPLAIWISPPGHSELVTFGGDFSSGEPVLMTLSPASAQALVARQAEGWGNADPDQIVADFAADCQFIAPGQHLLGRSQVYQAATEFFAANNRVEITVQRVISQENAVAVEWQWHETNLQTGQQQRADDAIIIQLNSQQQIVYWREYIDRRSA